MQELVRGAVALKSGAPRPKTSTRQKRR
jgi:hypothetical protein